MISIIVPIYKAEKYLHRCIDSILAQSYTDFELLLIDDGSPDNSGTIIDEYAEKDNRVRVFHKQNGGVSSARNLGIDQAHGEWITFIDIDDYVHPDFLSSLYKNHEADLVVGSFQIVGSEEEWNTTIEERDYHIEDLKANIVALAKSINFRTPWGKLFKSEILAVHNIRFDENIDYSEDWLFMLNYLTYTCSLKTCASPYYYYERGNVESLSQNTRHFDSYFYAMDAFRDTVNLMIPVYGNIVRSLYIDSVRGYFVRQCQYLYHSSDDLYTKLDKMRRIHNNVHIKNYLSDETLLWRKKIKFFHCLVSKGFLLTSLLYIRIHRGNIYG